MTARARVLVVDDMAADHLVTRLSESGLAAVAVSTAALSDRLSAGSVDAVVCTDSPGCDPATLVESVRESGWTVPVIVAARNGSEGLATRVLGAGADDYVALSSSALCERVRNSVGRPVSRPDGSTDQSGVQTAVTESGTPVPLEAVAGSLSEVLVTIDADSTVQYVNAAVEEVFGYDREAVQGSGLTMLMPDRFHNPHHDGVARYLETGDRALDWSSIELPGQHADGHEIDLEISFGEFTVDGERYFTGLIRDVTPLAARESALSALYEASQELLLAQSPAEIASVAVETASDALNLPVSGLYRYEDNQNALVPMANTEQADAMFGDPKPFEAGNSLAWESFQAGETRVYEGVDEDPTAQNPETPVRTELHVPVGDRWLLVSGSTEDIEFADYQIDFTELLATNTATALRRADRVAELRRYESIFESIDDRVCVLDDEGRFVMVNDALCAFLDREESALLGTSSARFVDPADAETIRKRLRSMAPEDSITIEVEVYPSAGDPLPCEIDFSPLPRGANMGGVVAAIHDISDRRRVESALARQQDRFEKLFDNIPDPAVEVRFDERAPIVQSVNPAFEETFGYEEGSVVGSSLNEFVLPTADDSRAEEMDRRAAAGGLVVEEVTRETDSGIRYFLFRGIPVETEDETVAFGIYTDITDQRLRERRLSVLNRVFRHNIRNNMTVVRGRAGVLQDNPDSSSIPDHASVIRRTAQSVVELAEGVRTAEQALEREDVPDRPLGDLVSESVDPYRDDADITVDLPEQALPSIDERAGIAIGELVENAVEHTDDDRATVDVALTVGDRTVSVAVSDDGPGIPENERTVIERQEETSLEHGEGIGLWLVHWITTTLGGEVALVENGPDGARISLVFPVRSTD